MLFFSWSSRPASWDRPSLSMTGPFLARKWAPVLTGVVAVTGTPTLTLRVDTTRLLEAVTHLLAVEVTTHLEADTTQDQWCSLQGCCTPSTPRPPNAPTRSPCLAETRATEQGFSSHPIRTQDLATYIHTNINLFHVRNSFDKIMHLC